MLQPVWCSAVPNRRQTWCFLLSKTHRRPENPKASDSDAIQRACSVGSLWKNETYWEEPMRETARPHIQGKNSPWSLGYEVQSVPKSASRSSSASLFPSPESSYSSLLLVPIWWWREVGVRPRLDRIPLYLYECLLIYLHKPENASC